MNILTNKTPTIAFLLLLASFLISRPLAFAGTWTPLVHQAPDGIGTMLLLSDGSVLAQGSANAWFLLKPDIHGSYVNGSWTTVSPMHDSRLYYASAVLRDARVFVAGAEYGSGGATAEIYDPLTDSWTLTAPAGISSFSDAISKILPNGNMLLSPVSLWNGTMIYNPFSNTWSNGPPCFGGQNEVSWLKLPDDSILTIDRDTTSAERYIPSLNTWIHDASVPVPLYSGSELGPAILLPNGKALFIGANGNTALYTPSGSTNNGSWVAGPTGPALAGAPDAPAAWMVNGHVLCALVPAGATNYSIFADYDPIGNSFTTIVGPDGATNYPYLPYYTRMLDLPNGTVLYTRSGTQLYQYDPGVSPLVAGKPAISSLTTNADGSYHLAGTLFNGIAEGAAYGDDAQMDSNFPLVRLTDAAGNIYYARTYNWSSTSVMTGNKVVTAEFVVPQEVPAGQYNLVVVANGINSDSISFFSGSLRITPGANVTSSGAVGGPFTITSQTFTLTNVGATPITWSLMNTSSWLAASQIAGGLNPGGPATSLAVSLNLAASNLVVGAYSTVLIFSNLTERSVQTRRFSLSVANPDQPIAYSGNNANLVLPANATGGNTATYLTASFGGWGFYAAGLNPVNYTGGSATNEGLPSSGLFTSVYDGVTRFQLGPYGTPTNALLMSPHQGFAASATLTLSNPKPYKSLSILASSGNAYSASAGMGSLVIHFTNGTSSASIPFFAQDWFQPVPNVGLTHFGRIYTGNYGLFYADNPAGNNPNLYHTKIDLLALGLGAQSVSSITFTMPPDAQNQSEDTAIFALSGSTTGIGPAPVFAAVTKTNSTITLSWTAVPGLKYLIQYKTDFNQPLWKDLVVASIATNTSMSLTDTTTTDQSRFYRAVLLP